MRPYSSEDVLQSVAHSVLALQHSVPAQFSARASACCLGVVAKRDLVCRSDGRPLLVYVGPWRYIGRQLLPERLWAWGFVREAYVRGNMEPACVASCLSGGGRHYSKSGNEGVPTPPQRMLQPLASCITGSNTTAEYWPFLVCLVWSILCLGCVFQCLMLSCRFCAFALAGVLKVESILVPTTCIQAGALLHSVLLAQGSGFESRQNPLLFSGPASCM